MDLNIINGFGIREAVQAGHGHGGEGGGGEEATISMVRRLALAAGSE